MQRRRIVAAVAMAATAGTAVALTLPAIAGTDSTKGRAPGAKASAGGDVAPDVLAAMKRDLGLTGDQARERLRREKWATGVAASLRMESGGAYAGAWLNADAGKLMIAVTDPALADQVRAVGAEPKVVERSEHQLDAAKQQLDEEALRSARQLPGWFVDVASNSIVLLAKPDAQQTARDFVAAAGVPAGAVRVVPTKETPVPLFDLRGGDAFFVGRFRCSVGFSVTGGFVTAGHCGKPGTTTTGFNRAAQGTFTKSSFPGDDYGVVEVNGDWTPKPVVNANGKELPVAGSREAPVGASVCRTGSTTGTRCGVIQARNVTVNYPEGRVTGLTRTTACAEGGDSGGAWLSGDQAQGVTSGGTGDCRTGGATFFQPINEVLATEKLTLVTSGAAPPEQPAPPTTAPPTTAPPAEEPTAPPADEKPTAPPADEKPTGAPTTPPPAQNPPATAPPTTAPPAQNPPAQNPPTAAPTSAPPAADACTGFAANRRGKLVRSGARQIQPRGGHFRAGAGRHTACLDGPRRADFDLFLQRWTRHGWRTVARSTGPGGDERLTFTGPAGTYRYKVRSDRGAGSYALGFTAP